jgi:hypothetical protein
LWRAKHHMWSLWCQTDGISVLFKQGNICERGQWYGRRQGIGRICAYRLGHSLSICPRGS